MHKSGIEDGTIARVAQAYVAYGPRVNA